MPLSLNALLGLTTRFTVVVDGMDLGGWGHCHGLSVDFKYEAVEDGGNYEHVTILPNRLEYKTITLKRAMNAQDSMKVQNWLRQQVSRWVNARTAPVGGTAQITLLDSRANPVTSWQLRNVYPARWDGPELDASTAGIAMETLELVHEGFL
ncbi:phage tail protein [Amycolatopsis anabasis]|uniref:phage tail protein n=1 Tax=Amycolatopsis anabasis TaxID=1840409 RepID=UPI00131C9EF4|nr:phage tail protein [Amycolatopsis anabasis]